MAGYLVYLALAAAALTYLITRDLRSTISVVIVAGACGIAAGTPLAILGAIGRAARLGAIIKGGLYLETLGRVDTVVLDKTGTLTYGRPEVQQVIAAEGVTRDAVLDAAATAEVRSEHPLGQAIVAYARAQGRSVREPDTFDYAPGRGIAASAAGKAILVGNHALLAEHGVAIPAMVVTSAEAASEIMVACDGRLLGAIVVADTVRPEAKQAIEALSRMRMRTILLTGDTRSVAEAVASRLGIAEFHADLLPEDKLTRIKALIGGGRVVAMLGDGINDAPALTEANVGVAMGSGTDVARESADVVLLANDLMRFVDTVAIARRTRRIIWQNFAGTIAVDTIGIVLAGVGVLNPLLAAFIHVASEMVFILNSARLLPAAERADGAGSSRRATNGSCSATQGLGCQRERKRHDCAALVLPRTIPDEVHSMIDREARRARPAIYIFLVVCAVVFFLIALPLFEQDKVIDQPVDKNHTSSEA